MGEPIIILWHKDPVSGALTPVVSHCHFEDGRLMCPKDGYCCPVIYPTDQAFDTAKAKGEDHV